MKHLDMKKMGALALGLMAFAPAAMAHLVSPSMFFLLTMGLMKAMRAFDMIYMFIGKDAWSTGGPLLEAVRTMVYGIYFNGFTRMDMGMASAESVVLFIMIMIVTGIQFKLQDKWVNYD